VNHDRCDFSRSYLGTDPKSDSNYAARVTGVPLANR
jgi:hypothetical protein